MALTNENSLITVKRLSEYNEKLFGAQGTASESVLATDENGGHQGLISALDRKKINILYERAGLKDSVSFSSLSSNPAGGNIEKKTTGETYTVTKLIFNSVSIMENGSSVTPTTSNLKFYYKKPGDTTYTEIQTTSVVTSGTTFTLTLTSPIDISRAANSSISGKVGYKSLMSQEKSVSYTVVYKTYHGALTIDEINNLSTTIPIGDNFSGSLDSYSATSISDSNRKTYHGALTIDEINNLSTTIPIGDNFSGSLDSYSATSISDSNRSWEETSLAMKRYFVILRPTESTTFPKTVVDHANNDYTYNVSTVMNITDGVSIGGISYKKYVWKEPNTPPIEMIIKLGTN